ncbi:MAG: cell division protein ZapA [Prevotellaceae bacterium]|jgi:cell division protein ZapA|nr:cell division protein ZapA [Prevotellaceae bacterium]MDY3856706.1 cell division protein ZapA [Bacteroidaceae bacterium]
MNDSDTLSIQLTIGSKTYPLEIDRRYEEIYRRAAQLINEKIRRYINVFPDQEKEDYMAMALIDIAVSLTQETGIDDRVRDMIHTIDQVLQLDKK